MKTDWGKIRLAYINSTKSLRELAIEFGVRLGSISGRCTQDGWARDRQRQRESVEQAAQAKLAGDRVAELAKFNDDDVVVAKALRGKSVALLTKLGNDISPSDLRMLAGTFEVAQRMGRLALGAETEVATVKTMELPPVSVDEFV